MRKKVRVVVVLTLVLVLVALALPALGAETIEGTASSEGILDTPGTSSGTKALVEDLYPSVPAPPENFGGSLNIAD